MLVSRISQLMALAARTANSTAWRLSTGSAPGRPRQVGQTWVLGSPPYSLRQPQKALDCVSSWTWTSRPMTGWYLSRTSGESAVGVASAAVILAIESVAGAQDRISNARGVSMAAERKTSTGQSGARGKPERKSAGGDESSASNDSGQKGLDRPSAEDIYKQVAHNARAELKRSTVSLGISGFAGGVFMGLSALGTAITLGMLGTSPVTMFVGKMFYPLGFIVVLLGLS